MFGALSRLFGKTADAAPFSAPLAPDAPFSVIGDVHGCAELLDRLVGMLDPSEPLIFVGDYIDRGPESAQVLSYLDQLSATRPVVCLKGNHEQMCLDFLEAPESPAGRRWLQHGGGATLASYGIDAEDEPNQIASALHAKMGATRIAWLRDLAGFWLSGNVAVVHAAADPEAPLTEQSADTLIWGHPKFRSNPRKDGHWVVHGHTIVPKPYAEEGRIALDTGAYLSGRLTAVTIHAGRHFFTQSEYP
ncbi:metallophosphoesterase family protein [Cognatishimia sp. MH4019]|uniref:metallophosphoesterase family protein n=1 Tax=Cognatishimia sp. MH4019 TaxID=2854030 RepID=UPI001CD454E9|nr:metallophosphoesterase family protein [Cognatishimia sp. MH4019]